MSDVNRLPPPFGRLIDRSQRLRFTFEGRRIEAFAGDTIASALAANDVWVLSRSFKYHRPRGILTMSGDDGNTLVQIGREPNVPADMRPVENGIVVTGQNYVGSLATDRRRWIERFARFLPVGFYYHAFHRPRGAWALWENVFRNWGGLGRVDTAAPWQRRETVSLHADIAVIGGGAAGLAAALEAAEAGAEVVLVERGPRLGGAALHARFSVAMEETQDRIDALVRAVERSPRIVVLTDAVATGCFADRLIPVMQHMRCWRLRARNAVIIATGAIEQPMVFRNNDLPGIMLGSAAQRLIRLYGVRPGRRAVIATAGAGGYGVALDLEEAGVEVAAILDLRAEPAPDPLSAAAAERGLAVVAGTTIAEAYPNRRGDHVAAVRVMPVAAEGMANGGRKLDCDLVCMATGWAPAAALLGQAGARVVYDEQIAGFAVEEMPAGTYAAGAVAGETTFAAAIAGGRSAGRRAAGEEAPASSHEDIGGPTNHPWPIVPHPKGKEFVDYDEDLTVEDLRNTVAEGFVDIELVKRYSTVGMGPSQGRVSALNAVRIAHRAAGRPLAGATAWTIRPPVAAERLDLIAGPGFAPLRLSPMHTRHLELEAEVMVAGSWLRPACYGKRESATVAKEVRAVRETLGAIDVSTLGSIEVRGPDAAELLNRLYTLRYDTLAVGRVRYALICNEDGTIFDDGVVCRLAKNHFYLTATTANAQAVFRRMLWWNAQWRLRADILDVTSAFAAVSLAGPQARRCLAELCDDVDLEAGAFPFMAVRCGTVAGIAARLVRVGFVGELGYEIHVPAGEGEALWDAVLAIGRKWDLHPVGIEAQRVLRLEKGHLIVGQDTDGLSWPDEVGLNWALAEDKPYFVGARAIAARRRRGLRRRLVGFVLLDDADPLPEEGHLVLRDGEIVGRITSIARSPTLGQVLGLAYVMPDDASPGTRITIKGPDGRLLTAETARPPFYDPQGERQRQ